MTFFKFIFCLQSTLDQWSAVCVGVAGGTPEISAVAVAMRTNVQPQEPLKDLFSPASCGPSRLVDQAEVT